MTLAALVLIPALGGLALILLPRDRSRLATAIALVSTGAALALSTWILLDLRLGDAGDSYRFALRVGWIPSLGAELSLAVDGLRALLLFVTALIGSGIALIGRGERAAGPLLLQASLSGGLASLDLLLLTVFWTLALLAVGLMLPRRGSAEATVAGRWIAVALVSGTMLAAGAVLTGTRAGTYDLAILAAGETFREVPGHGRLAFVLLLIGFSGPLVLVPRAGGRGENAPATAAETLLLGAATKLGALGILGIALTVAPRAAADLALVPLIAGGTLLALSGALATRTDDPDRLAGLSGGTLTGLVLLAAGALAAGAGETVALGAMAALVAHGLLAGAFGLTRLADDPFEESVDPGLAGTVVGFGLVLLPAFAALGGHPSSLLEAIRLRPVETAVTVIGLGLVALAMVRAILRARGSGPIVGERGNGTRLHLAAVVAIALLFGLVPRILFPLLEDAAGRIVYVISTGAMP